MKRSRKTFVFTPGLRFGGRGRVAPRRRCCASGRLRLLWLLLLLAEVVVAPKHELRFAVHDAEFLVLVVREHRQVLG